MPPLFFFLNFLLPFPAFFAIYPPTLKIFVFNFQHRYKKQRRLRHSAPHIPPMTSNLETCILTLIAQTAKFSPFLHLKTFLNFVKWVYALQNYFILSNCTDGFKKYGKILIKLFLLINVRGCFIFYCEEK